MNSKLELSSLSVKEASRLSVIEQVRGKLITQAKGAEQLGLSVRQLRRLMRRYEEQGPLGLASNKRGRVSNNRIPAKERSRVSGLIKAHYPDFGPTLAHEKLKAFHQVHLSVETIRQIMMDECGWLCKSRKRKSVHQSR